MAEIACGRCYGTGEGDPASDRPLCPDCGGTGFVDACMVGGCNRPARGECDTCGIQVCGRHREHVAGLDLCYSCAIGMKDGMDMMRGWSE